VATGKRIADALTTSTVKLVTASADSSHLDLPPGTGVRIRISAVWKIYDAQLSEPLDLESSMFLTGLVSPLHA
jgi:hypothetical protein